MVTAGEATIHPALQHVIERGDFLCHADRIVCRHGVADDPGLEPLAVLTDEQAEHPGMIVGLEPFDLEVMLWLAVAVVSEIIGKPYVPRTSSRNRW